MGNKKKYLKRVLMHISIEQTDKDQIEKKAVKQRKSRNDLVLNSFRESGLIQKETDYFCDSCDIYIGEEDVDWMNDSPLCPRCTSIIKL